MHLFLAHNAIPPLPLCALRSRAGNVWESQSSYPLYQDDGFNPAMKGGQVTLEVCSLAHGCGVSMSVCLCVCLYVCLCIWVMGVGFAPASNGVHMHV